MYRDEQTAAWRRIVEFAHAHGGGVAIGAQLGHSGRKGSTKLMWEGIDRAARRRQLAVDRALGRLVFAT